MAAETPPWRVGVDVGGTFADCVALMPGGGMRRIKLLSDGRKRVAVSAGDGVPAGGASANVRVEGLPAWCGPALVGATATNPAGETAEVLDCGGTPAVLTLSKPLRAGRWLDLTTGEEAPIWGCRLLTGTPPAAPLPACVLHVSTTRGTNSLLEGEQQDVGAVVNAGLEGVIAIGTQQRLGIFDLAPRTPPQLAAHTIGIACRIAADGSVIQPVQRADVERCAADLRARGVRHVAIALIHSWRDAAQEETVAEVFRAAGFESVATSAELAAVPRLVPRAQAALVEARLHAPVRAYLNRIEEQANSGAGARARAGPRAATVIRAGTSSGGVVNAAAYRAKDSLLSGPAAGCRGAETAMRAAGITCAVTLDMGGTSTDVARIDEHGVALRFETTVAGITVATPSVDVHSVAAGGGSVCVATRDGLFVGPRSAGANPGPACYGKGGPLTITDVNLLLGRLCADGSSLPLDTAAAQSAADAAARGSGRPVSEMLQGFLEIANEHMAAAVRTVSTAAGHDPRNHTLVVFGGAGGQHACAVAERLGVARALVLPHAGFVSGQGALMARPERTAEVAVLRPLRDVVAIGGALESARARARDAIAADGVRNGVTSRVVAVLRAAGRTGTVLVDLPVAERDVNKLAAHARAEFVARMTALGDPAAHEEPECDSIRVVQAEALQQVHSAPGALCADFAERTRSSGPTLIVDDGSTIVVDSGWRASPAPGGGVWLERAETHTANPRNAAIDLEVAAARFVAIATWVGTCLERAAQSVNVKERLDFSCGVLDAAGQLVANAPHIPVHLGALGECVRSMLKVIDIGPGQVAATNDPRHGGSHLPDLTVVRAVHSRGGALLGYVAARAHHAEIGGSVPGSMPPDAKSLEEEGVLIPPCIIANNGVLDVPALAQILAAGRFPSRDPAANIADINAAVAALDAGAQAIAALAEERGEAVTRAAMQQLLARSAGHVRELAKALAPNGPYTADARLDDGTPFTVHIAPHADGTIDVDINAPGLHPRSFNAPLSVTRSAVLYVLRVLCARAGLQHMDDHVAPLNEGFLQPVTLRVTPGFLNAFADPACARSPASELPPVFAGNTECSQRVVDALLLALGAAACSQGTMNNLVFGNANFSVYETIGGGAGACDGAHGANSVHVHMSNTRLTDPETLELRHPVRLEKLQVRQGSGGSGAWRGGSGTIRRIRMLQPVSVSFISQHRIEVPEGLRGGSAGAVGEQFIVRADGTQQPVAGSFTAELAAGDAVEIRTPGGGGYGAGAAPPPT